MSCLQPHVMIVTHFTFDTYTYINERKSVQHSDEHCSIVLFSYHMRSAAFTLCMFSVILSVGFFNC